MIIFISNRVNALTSRIIALIERRPSIGWLGSGASAAGALAANTANAAENMERATAGLPAVPANLTAWLTAIGAVFAIIGGFFTALIQIRNWWRGRKASPSPSGPTQQQPSPNSDTSK